MENENNYYERRKKNRKAYLGGKRTEEEKHKRSLRRTDEKIYYLKNSIDTILNEENEILDILKMRNRMLELLKDIRNPLSDFYDFTKAIRLPIDNFSERFRYGRKKTEKVVREYISKIDGPLKNYLGNMILGVNELSKIILQPIDSADIESQDSFRKELAGILGITDIRDYNEFKDIISKLKGGLKKNFFESAEKYRKALESNKASFKEEMQYTAQLNNKLLEKECNNINEDTTKKINEYFSSLEGMVLSYCTYQLELKNVRDDDFYAFFLDDKALNKLSILKSEDFVEVIGSLNSLYKKGNIKEDEYISLKKILENELKEEKTEIVASAGKDIKAESIEDIKRRANFIADYKIPLSKALEIAKLIKDENLARIPRELAYGLEGNLAELLIQNNPELFLMDEKETERYLGSFKKTKELVKRFGMVEDFDPYKSPKNFAGFDALEETRRRFGQMVGEFVNTRRETETRDDMSEIESIKIDLETEGYDSDLALIIIKSGFYFHGKYYTGRNKRNIERIEDSIRKYLGREFDHKRFDKELRKLVASEAVKYKKGYSLNPHVKEIKSEAVRRAMNYSLTHHPREDDENDGN